MEDNKEKTVVFDDADSKKISEAELELYEESIASSEENEESEENEGKSVKKLVLIIVIMAVLFLATLVWGFLSITSDKKEPAEEKPPVTLAEEENVVEALEEEAEEEVTSSSYKIKFKKGSVENEDEGYTVRTYLYKEGSSAEDERRLIVNEETEIREEKTRIENRSFIDIIEAAGDKDIYFDCVIDEETDVIISIKYDKKIIDELQKEEELASQESEVEITINENVENENIPEEEIEEPVVDGI